MQENVNFFISKIMRFSPSNAVRMVGTGIFLLSGFFLFPYVPTTFAGNFGSGVTLDTNTHAAGYRAYAEGDIDNNGTPDVVGEASSGVLSVTKDLSGTPSYEVQSHIPAESTNFYASALADLDGDGDLDLVTAGPNGNTASPNNVYYWDAVTHDRYEKAGSTYTLTGNTTFFYGTGVVTGDFTNDNKPDVLWFGFDKAYIGINSTTTSDNLQFSSITDTGLAIDNNTIGNFSAATGDFNNDGNLDFVLTGNSFIGGLWGGYYQVGYGDGNGGFTLSTPAHSGDGYQPTAVAIGDFNDDGKDDFVLARSVFPTDGQLIVYLRNAGNTGFDETTIATSGSGTLKGVQGADVNNDGFPDVVVQSNLGSSMEVYFNQGDGTFPDTPSLTLNNGYSEQFFLTDINLDGLSDILTLVDDNIRYYPQTGDNLFTNPSAETGDFTGWNKVDGGSGWGIFDDYNDAHGGYRSFMASYANGTLSQEVDLVAKGYSPTYLDSQPPIVVSDYVKGRWPNFADPYRVIIELRDTSHNAIATYDTGTQIATNTWEQISNTFNAYGAGVRYIYLERVGTDAEFWLGQYGVAFDSASAYIGTLSNYHVTYTAGANGSLSGNTSQTINSGEDGTAVTPVPNPGYVFDSWDDGSVRNPRIETDVRSDHSLIANFVTLPPAPTSFAATAVGSDVELTWINPVNVDFDSVMIRRSTSAFPTNETDGTLVIENITATTYTDTGLADGLYYYSIFAKNNVGIYSVAATASVTVDTTPPAAPTDFTGIASSGDLNVTWTNPPDVDFESVTIRRSTSGYPATETDGDLVTQNETGTSYNDTSLASGTYYYSIFAVDASGNFSSAAHFTITIDVTHPTVILSSGEVNSGGSTKLPSLSFIVTFSEDVSAFTAGDITIANGTVSNVTEITAHSQYSFNVTPTSAGSVSVRVLAGVVEDDAGNGNVTSNLYTFTYSLAKIGGSGGGGGLSTNSTFNANNVATSGNSNSEIQQNSEIQPINQQTENIPGILTVPFYDIVDHWSKDFVLELYTLNIVQGRAPHLFVPDGTLTNAEAVKIGLLVFGYSLDANDFRSGYTDLDVNAWYIPYVRKAKKEGFISGTRFHPDNPINRIDALVMYIKMAKKFDKNTSVAPFKDVSQKSSVAGYVNYAYAKGIIIGRGTSGDTFEPLSTITRGEIAKIALKLKAL